MYNDNEVLFIFYNLHDFPLKFLSVGEARKETV